ncbi:Aspartic peptidase [Gossypium australe]|uniref:Aspartic peptidase n=1 Tax=Gossypium australe TaxID=47621 RepID=A0A5B6WG96_9ROSI|nr:Aspartic peptidase [Gossypium australe]
MDRTIICSIDPINPKGLVNKLQNHLKLSHQLVYMVKNDTWIQSRVATLKNMENRIGQLATKLRSRLQGALPSDTKNPRNFCKEHCKILEPKEVVVENELIKKEESQPTVEVPTIEKLHIEKFDEVNPKLVNSKNITPYFEDFPPQKSCPFQPKVPYAQRLQQYKGTFKFLDVLKQLHINIPLVEALEQMPNYVIFVKDILSKKKRLGEYETFALTGVYSAFLQNKLPLNFKDPDSFTISCNIEEFYHSKASCDLGASINLMPKYIFKILGIGEVRPITVTLQLVNHSLAYSEGKIEDVLFMK